MPRMVAVNMVMNVAMNPISSELRPPYSSRTATSRPLESAPRKKRPCHVGPIGMPCVETTSLSLPPTRTWSVTWFSAGVVCATCFAYTGASRHMRTMTRKSAPKASATLLRLSRRHASSYGPMPGGACSSGRTSVENSVPAVSSVAMGLGARPVVPGGPLSLLVVELEARPVVAVHGVEDRRPEVDPVAEELRSLLLPVHEHVGLLGRVLVELLPLLLDRVELVGRDGVELRQLALDVRVVHLAEVLVVRRLDRVLVEQQVEVARVREVLEPVGEARLRVGLQVADGREVLRVGQDLGLRL